MPRKNPKDSAVVVAFLKQQRWFRESGWSLQAINGLSQIEVAKVMQKSLVFLAFGHPEGFGLQWQKRCMWMLFNWLLWFRW